MKAHDFRQAARDALKGNWFVAIIAGIIASIFGGLNSSGMGFSFSFNFEMPEVDNNESVASLISSAQNGVGVNTGMYDGIIIFLMILFGIVFIYSLIMFIIGSAVSIGYSEFNLDLIDGAKPKIGSLFSRFGQLGTAIWANIMVFVRILIGLFLFVIPGVIMSYTYAMINFVMAENPDMTAREALRESKRIMKGNRWKLFCLSLSFIGWALLSVITFGIGLIWFVPYQQAALAAFYREVSGGAEYIGW